MVDLNLTIGGLIDSQFTTRPIVGDYVVYRDYEECSYANSPYLRESTIGDVILPSKEDDFMNVSLGSLGHIIHSPKLTKNDVSSIFKSGIIPSNWGQHHYKCGEDVMGKDDSTRGSIIFRHSNNYRIRLAGITQEMNHADRMYMLMDKVNIHNQGQKMNTFFDYTSYQEVLNAVESDSFHPIAPTGDLVLDKLKIQNQLMLNYLFTLHPDNQVGLLKHMMVVENSLSEILTKMETIRRSYGSSLAMGNIPDVLMISRIMEQIKCIKGYIDVKSSGCVCFSHVAMYTIYKMFTRPPMIHIIGSSNATANSPPSASASTSATTTAPQSLPPSGNPGVSSKVDEKKTKCIWSGTGTGFFTSIETPASATQWPNLNCPSPLNMYGKFAGSLQGSHSKFEDRGRLPHKGKSMHHASPEDRKSSKYKSSKKTVILNMGGLVPRGGINHHPPPSIAKRGNVPNVHKPTSESTADTADKPDIVSPNVVTPVVTADPAVIGEVVHSKPISPLTVDDLEATPENINNIPPPHSDVA